MQDTLINFLAVVIIGNLALLGAWALGGIVWFAVGDFFKGSADMLKIGMNERKRIRLIRSITWTNGACRAILPAGWEGEVERVRPGSVSTLPDCYEICDCFLTDMYVREVRP